MILYKLSTNNKYHLYVCMHWKSHDTYLTENNICITQVNLFWRTKVIYIYLLFLIWKINVQKEINVQRWELFRGSLFSWKESKLPPKVSNMILPLLKMLSPEKWYPNMYNRIGWTFKKNQQYIRNTSHKYTL